MRRMPGEAVQKPGYRFEIEDRPAPGEVENWWKKAGAEKIIPVDQMFSSLPEFVPEGRGTGQAASQRQFLSSELCT